MSHPFQALLDETHDPQTFVRKSLGLLEDQFRKIALFALADWHKRNIFCADLFQAIVSLQRPSWGHWNGLISALRNARKQVLRSHGPEDRQKLQDAALLNRTLDIFDERLPPELLTSLAPLATLLNQKLRAKHRNVELLSMPIAMRNRIAHDVPGDTAWWQTAAEGLRVLLAFHVKRDILGAIRQETPYPSPWFLHQPEEEKAASPSPAPHVASEEDAAEAAMEATKEVQEEEPIEAVNPDDIWTFNGLGKDFSVTYVHPRKRSRHRKDATQATLLAFQQLLGRADAYEGDFKKLLAKLAPEDLKGVFMGDFLVGRPVGAGGFATVHVGRQLSTGRQVAIKILHDGMDEEMADRFRQEARYLSQFRHPNIVGVISYGEETWSAPRQRDLVRSLKEEDWYKRFSKSAPVKTYIVLEWVEGFTLEDIYQAQHKESEATTQRSAWLKPDQRQLARWFAQAANALTAVHALGLIHRDVKPANLMVNVKGQLKLMDFGIARSQDENRTLVTTFGHNVGTPAYMSPEQIKASLGDATLGPHTDIYSLSATFYELFTKRRLYLHDKETMESVQTKKLEGQLPLPPRAVVEGLPWEIETILMGGLQAEISDRYASMEALEQDLHRFLADEPIAYKRPSLLRQLQLNYRRHTNMYRLVLLFLVLVGSGLYAHLSQLSSEQKKTAKARWLAVNRANQAEHEKKRALRAEAAARRAEEAAKQKTLQAMRAQRAERIGRMKLLIQRKKLLETQRRFLLERLQMIKQNTLKRTGAETMLSFFQEVLKETGNPISHQLLALRGIALVLTQKAYKHKLDIYLQARVLNKLFASLLRRAMKPPKTQKEREVRRQSLFAAMYLAPHIDQQSMRLAPLVKQYTSPAAHKLWATALDRDPIWLSPPARLLGLLLQESDPPTRIAAGGVLLAMGYHRAFSLRQVFLPIKKWQHRVSEALFLTLVSQPSLEQLGRLPLQLLEELGDGDTTTRLRALRLSAAHGPRATPLLLSAFSDSDYRVRTAAKKLLIALGPAAIPHIGQGLDSQETLVRYACVRTLGKMGPQAYPYLIKALGHEHYSTASLAFFGLLPHVKKLQPAHTKAIQKLLHSPHQHCRTLAIKLMCTGQHKLSPAHKATLWTLLTSRSRQERYQVLRLLAQVASTKEVAQHQKRLMRMVKADEEPSSMLREKALVLLALLGKPALPLLLRALNDPQRSLRKAAREGLVRLGSIAFPALKQLLQNPKDWVCRREAVRILGQIGRRDPRVLPLLTQALRDAHDNVRVEVVDRLGRFGPVALPSLRPLVQDPSELVRTELAKALQFHKKAGIPALFKLLADENGRVRRQAMYTLQDLPCPQSVDLPALLRAHRRNPWHVRRYMRKCLGTKTPQALLKVAQSQLPDWVRGIALTRLVRSYRNPKVIQAFARATQDPSFRLQRIGLTELRLKYPPPALRRAWFRALQKGHHKVKKYAFLRLIHAKLTPAQRTKTLRLALGGSNETVHYKALYYLRKELKKSWLPLLYGVAKSRKRWLLTRLARLLRRLAKTNQPTQRAAIKLLRQIAWKSNDYYTRYIAFWSLTAFGKEGSRVLRSAYENKRLRIQALRAISEQKSVPIEQLALARRSLRTSKPRERRYAATIIGKLGKHATQDLLTLLKHRNQQLRSAALMGLRYTQHWHHSLRAPLFARLKDDSYVVKRQAIFALHHTKHRAIPHLLHFLRANKTYLSRAALITLVDLDVPTEEIAEGVLYALSSRDRSIRKNVRSAIRQKVRDEPALVLWFASRITNPKLRRKLWRYFLKPGRPMKLARLLHHDEHPMEIATSVGWFGFHPSHHPLVQRGRQLVAWLLGQTCRPDAVPHLKRALLRDPSVLVRTQAALSLGRMGPLASKAKSTLRKAMREDPSHEVKRAAAAAYKRLNRPLDATEDHVDRARNLRCFRIVKAAFYGQIPFANPHQ